LTERLPEFIRYLTNEFEAAEISARYQPARIRGEEQQTLNWTDQGIHKVKDAPKRKKAAKELAKKLGIEIKNVYLTSGDDDLLLIIETLNGDNVAKFALAISSQANVRTRTVRAWPEPEVLKLISELP
jgi:uncharacterized protein with GYD domain